MTGYHFRNRARSFALRLRAFLHLGIAGLLMIAVGGCQSALTTETARQSSRDSAGSFLAISDIHLDPFLDLTSAQFIALAAAPLGQWPQKLAGQPAATYGADAPFALAQSALNDAQARLPNPDFILFPGDFLAHGWQQKYDRLAPRSRAEDPEAYQTFTTQVMRLMAAQFREAFPDTPILPVLGNDDSYCGDYMIGPDSPFLAMFAEVWEPLVFSEPHRGSVGETHQLSEADRRSRREFRQTVRRGGFYSLRLPRLPRHRLVALNTVFLTPQYSNACGDAWATPALDQFEWLEETLAEAEASRESVWLLMHVPPGIDGYATHRMGAPQPLWQPEMTARFLQLLRRYGPTIQVAFAGHTHMDDFRVVRGDEHPALLTKIIPAISPIFGNDPGYQIFQYDRRTGGLLDYTTFQAPLPRSESAYAWRGEYEFQSAYPGLALDPPSIIRLGQQVLEGGNVERRFTEYYSVSGPPTPVTNSILGCAILSATVADFTECFPASTGR